jgi:hypothetical protein
MQRHATTRRLVRLAYDTNDRIVSVDQALE